MAEGQTIQYKAGQAGCTEAEERTAIDWEKAGHGVHLQARRGAKFGRLSPRSLRLSSFSQPEVFLRARFLGGVLEHKKLSLLPAGNDIRFLWQHCPQESCR